MRFPTRSERDTRLSAALHFARAFDRDGESRSVGGEFWRLAAWVAKGYHHEHESAGEGVRRTSPRRSARRRGERAIDRRPDRVLGEAGPRGRDAPARAAGAAAQA